MDARIKSGHDELAHLTRSAARAAGAPRQSPGRILPPTEDNPALRCPQSALRHYGAPASAPAAADYTARFFHHRRRSTTAGARTTTHKAAAQSRRGGRRGSHIGRSGSWACAFSLLAMAGLHPASHLLPENPYEPEWMPGSSPGIN